MSAIAHPFFFDIYPYGIPGTLIDFLERTQSLYGIRRQSTEGMRYASVLEDGIRAWYSGFDMNS